MSKIQYTKTLGRLVASNIQNSKLRVRYHVILGLSQNWSVISENRKRAIKSFTTQTEAITFAKKKVAKRSGEVIVHSKTGQIKSTIPIGVQQNN